MHTNIDAKVDTEKPSRCPSTRCACGGIGGSAEVAAASQATQDELALEKHAQAETITGLVMKLSAKEMELSTKEQMVAELKKKKEALMREKRELMKEKRDLMRDKRELMTEKRELLRDKRELMRDKYELMAKLGTQRLKKQELLHNLNALKSFVSHNF